MTKIWLLVFLTLLSACNVKMGKNPDLGSGQVLNPGNGGSNGNGSNASQILAIVPGSIFVQTIVNQPVTVSIYLQNKTTQVLSSINSSLANNFSEIEVVYDECLTAILAPQASCRIDFEMVSSVVVQRNTKLNVSSSGFTNSADVVLKVLPDNTSLLAANAFQFVNQGSVLSDDLNSYVISGIASSFSIITQPTHGTVSLNASTGSVSYTPGLNYSGSDSFTYKALRTGGSSNTATFQIFVQDVASAPTAIDLNLAVTKNLSQSIVLIGQDDDNRPLSYSIVTQPAHGTLSGSGANRVYTPANNFVGSDTFTYRVNNGSFNSNTATVSINITANNSSPIASNNSVNVYYETPVTFTLVANDADQDTLTYSIVTQPLNGSISGSGSNLVYTPNSGFTGTDSLSFKVNDGTTDSNTATIAFSIGTAGGGPVGSNQAPVAQNQTVATQEDVPLSILLSATDANNNTLTYTVVTQPTNGTLSGSGQNLVYTPALDYSGTDSFTFRTNDGSLNSNTATISITVVPVADAPLALPVSVVTNKNLAANSSFVGVNNDGNSLTFSIVSPPSNGMVSVSANGFTYTPNLNYVGSDSFTYRAFNGIQYSNNAAVNIAVQAVNAAPVANNGSYSLENTSTANITLLASDVEGNTLTYSVLSQPTNGTLSGSAQNVVYTPNAGYLGSDSFTFKVNDGFLDSNVGTISLTVTPSTLNQAPLANNQNVTVAEDSSSSFALGVSDPNAGDTLTVILTQAPSNGTISFSGTNATYTPNANFNGNDNFSYQVSDGTLTSGIATVSISVTPVNDAPQLLASSYTTVEDTALLNFTIPAVDPENDQLTYQITYGTTNGTLTYNPITKTFDYTPNPNFTGTDSFAVTVSDGQITSAPSIYTITVTPENDAPVANSQNVAVTEDTPVDFVLSGTDPENSPLSYIIVTQPTNGTITGNAPNLTYTPNSNFTGSDSFSFKVSDGTSESAVVTISFSVSPVNDAPVSVAQTYSTTRNTAVPMTLIGQDIENSPLTYIIVNQPTNGTLSGAGANLTYTPNSMYVGSDSFTYKVNDGTLDSNTSTVSISVLFSNEAPIANAQTIAVVEDTPLSVTLSGSDSDGDTLNYIIVAQPTNGTLTGTGANLTYTPNPNFNGSDSFIFKINDGTTDSASVVISLSVSPVNDAPISFDQSVAVVEDTAKALTLQATDVDGNTLTYVVVSQPTNGTLYGTGANLTYTPSANFNGSDSFTFKANDGAIDSNLSTISLTVSGTNDAPIANAQTVAVVEDTAKAITLTGSDEEGSTLSYVIVTQPAHGTLTGTPPGLVYTPAANYFGPDSFSFKVNDGSIDSAVATVSLSVSAVNDAPVSLSQTVAVTEDTAKAITLQASDVDGDALTYAIVVAPLHGTITGTGANITYTPAANYFGSDSFSFKANDGTLDSNVSVVTLNISGVNDAPIANAQTVAVVEDTAKAITLSGLDPEGSNLTYSIVVAPLHGTISGTGANITYTPAANYFGTDSFSFKVNDGTTDSAPAIISLNISAVNDAPVSLSQTVAVVEDTAKPITLGSSDVENSPLTYTIVTQPLHGTISGSGANVVYTPAANYSGSDSFTFKTNDGSLDSNIATVTINVSNVNDAPVANPQTIAVIEDTATPFVLSGTDADGDSLNYIIVTQPAHGTITGTAPNFVYTPAANYFGTDTFSFKVNDGTTDSAVVTVSLNVSGVNDAPVASTQTVAVVEDTAKLITLVANDVDGNTLTYSIVTQPLHGTLSGTGANVTYTPAANYSGSDSFSFKANDGTVDSNTALVSINVSNVNDAPVALAQTIAVVEDTAKAIVLSGTDADGDTLTYSIVTAPLHGTISGTGANITYTPAANYFGTDTFSFKVNDGTTDSAAVTVSLNISPVNDAPVASAQTVAVVEDTAKAITLVATDVEGSALTYSIVAAPLHGTISGSGANIAYTPAANYSGVDSFTFKANDGTIDSNIATVTINVSNVNDAPVANAQTIAVVEDTAKPFTLTATDVDGNTLTYIIVTQPANGTLSGTAPNLTYTPAANFNGSDSFSFKANDGTTDSAVVTISLSVSPLNDAPVASAQTVAVIEDTAKPITLVATDVEGSPLTYTIVTQPTNGTLSGTGANRVYTPALNYNGSDSFSFKVNDGTIDSNVATITINVSSVNDAPVALAQTVSVVEDTAKSIILVGTDADGNTLTYSIVNAPANGTISGSGANIVYTPALNYNGADSFSFKVNDGTTDSNVAVVSISISAVNDVPVANTIAFTTPEDAVYNGILNGSDVDGNTLTYTIIGTPSNGTVTIINLQTGAFVYTPAANYFGTDSFSYKVNDGTFDSNIAMVNVTVSSVNDLPLANNQSISTNKNVAKTGTLTATDVESTVLTYSVVTAPSNGSVVINANGNFTYTPANNYVGADSFTFKANDGTANSIPATVSITVIQLNVPPVAQNQTITAYLDQTVVTGQAVATDADGNPLTYAQVGSTPGLTFNSNGSFSYANTGSNLPAGMTVSHQITSDYTSGYAYQIQFINNGATFNNWTVCFEYDHNVGNLGISNADIHPSSSQPTWKLTPKSYNEIVYTGQTISINWNASPGGLNGDTLQNLRLYTYANADCASTPNAPSNVAFNFNANDGMATSNNGTVTINFVTRDNFLKIATNPALVPHTLAGYPLLLDLQTIAPQDHFWDNVKTNGSDIVMTLADKLTRVPVDLRNFNKANRTGQLWFKGNITQSTSNVFYIHYNNAGSPASSAVAKTAANGAYNVWKNNYVGVWDMHLSTNTLQDATSFQHHMTQVSSPTSLSHGYIDQAMGFGVDNCDEDDRFIKTSTAALQLNDEVTISTWAYPTSSGADQILLRKESSGGKHNYALKLHNLKPQFVFDHNSAGKSIESVAIPLNQWSFIVGTFSSTTKKSRLYVNGVLVKEGSASTEDLASISTANLEIGGSNGASGGNDFCGFLDEMKLSPISLSAEWVLTEYNMTNQTNIFWLVDDETISFSDSFNRVDSNTLANTWTEFEGCSASSGLSLNLLGLLGLNIGSSSNECGYVRVKNNQMEFYDLQNPVGYPEAKHTWPNITSGKATLSFYVDFYRNSTENDYSVVMNFGENTKSVGELIWGSPSAGLTAHTGFGVVNKTTSVISQVKTLNHRELVVVSIDYNTKKYNLYMKGAGLLNVPFINNAAILNKLSIITNEIQSSQVPRVYIDNVVIKKK